MDAFHVCFRGEVLHPPTPDDTWHPQSNLPQIKPPTASKELCDGLLEGVGGFQLIGDEVHKVAVHQSEERLKSISSVANCTAPWVRHEA